MLLALLIAVATPSQAAIEARLTVLDHTLRTQEARLAAQQAPLAHLLATAQRLALRPPALALARPQAIDEMARTRALIATLAPDIRRRTAALRGQVIATEKLRAETEQTLAAMMENGGAGALRQSAQVTARLMALPAPDFGPAAPFATRTAYRLPVAGKVVVGMGERSDVGVRARGLTLATAGGAAIGAPARGRVAYAGPFRGYGDIVILDHGHGWTTLLAGLEFVTATSGELLEAGATLGHMARNAPRLTIELRHNGRAVDVAAMTLQ